MKIIVTQLLNRLITKQSYIFSININNIWFLNFNVLPLSLPKKKRVALSLISWNYDNEWKGKPKIFENLSIISYAYSTIKEDFVYFLFCAFTHFEYFSLTLKLNKWITLIRIFSITIDKTIVVYNHFYFFPS